MTCAECGHKLQIGDYPFCSKDGSHLSGSNSVIGDDIPGGVLIEHGLCNKDGSPRRYYSKSAMAAEAKARGLVNWVEHKGDKSSDKSDHTTRWV